MVIRETVAVSPTAGRILTPVSCLLTPAPVPRLLMLRVALVTGNYNYAIDGVALTCNRQVGYLERCGVPVKVFAPTKPRPLFPHAGELVSVPSVPLPTTPYRLALGLPPLVRKELAAFRPTLVHLCTPDLLGFAALRWAGYVGFPWLRPITHTSRLI